MEIVKWTVSYHHADIYNLPNLCQVYIPLDVNLYMNVVWRRHRKHFITEKRSLKRFRLQYGVLIMINGWLKQCIYG